MRAWDRIGFWQPRGSKKAQEGKTAPGRIEARVTSSEADVDELSSSAAAQQRQVNRGKGLHADSASSDALHVSGSITAGAVAPQQAVPAAVPYGTSRAEYKPAVSTHTLCDAAGPAPALVPQPAACATSACQPPAMLHSMQPLGAQHTTISTGHSTVSSTYSPPALHDPAFPLIMNMSGLHDMGASGPPSGLSSLPSNSTIASSLARGPGASQQPACGVPCGIGAWPPAGSSAGLPAANGMLEPGSAMSPPSVGGMHHLAAIHGGPGIGPMTAFPIAASLGSLESGGLSLYQQAMQGRANTSERSAPGSRITESAHASCSAHDSSAPSTQASLHPGSGTCPSSIGTQQQAPWQSRPSEQNFQFESPTSMAATPPGVVTGPTSQQAVGAGQSVAGTYGAGVQQGVQGVGGGKGCVVPGGRQPGRTHPAVALHRSSSGMMNGTGLSNIGAAVGEIGQLPVIGAPVVMSDQQAGAAAGKAAEQHEEENTAAGPNTGSAPTAAALHAGSLLVSQGSMGALLPQPRPQAWPTGPHMYYPHLPHHERLLRWSAAPRHKPFMMHGTRPLSSTEVLMMRQAALQQQQGSAPAGTVAAAGASLQHSLQQQQQQQQQLTPLQHAGSANQRELLLLAAEAAGVAAANPGMAAAAVTAGNVTSTASQDGVVYMHTLGLGASRENLGPGSLRRCSSHILVAHPGAGAGPAVGGMGGHVQHSGTASTIAAVAAAAGPVPDASHYLPLRRFVHGMHTVANGSGAHPCLPAAGVHPHNLQRISINTNASARTSFEGPAVLGHLGSHTPRTPTAQQHTVGGDVLPAGFCNSLSGTWTCAPTSAESLAQRPELAVDFSSVYGGGHEDDLDSMLSYMLADPLSSGTAMYLPDNLRRLQEYLQVLSLEGGSRDKYLFVARQRIPPAGCRMVGGFLAAVHGVRVVTLTHAGINDEGVEQLATALASAPHSDLWVLDLRHNRIRDAGAAALAKLLCGTAPAPSTPRAGPSQSGAPAAGSTQSSTNGGVLSAQSHTIARAGSSGLNNTCSNNGAAGSSGTLSGGAGAATHLGHVVQPSGSTAGGYSALMRRSASRQSMASDGAPGVRCLAALRELVLSHNCIGDEGVLALADALYHASTPLRVRIGHNPVSADAVRDLASAHKSRRSRRAQSRSYLRPLSAAGGQQPLFTQEMAHEAHGHGHVHGGPRGSSSPGGHTWVPPGLEFGDGMDSGGEEWGPQVTGGRAVNTGQQQQGRGGYKAGPAVHRLGLSAVGPVEPMLTGPVGPGSGAVVGPGLAPAPLSHCPPCMFNPAAPANLTSPDPTSHVFSTTNMAIASGGLWGQSSSMAGASTNPAGLQPTQLPPNVPGLGSQTSLTTAADQQVLPGVLHMGHAGMGLGISAAAGSGFAPPGGGHSSGTLFPAFPALTATSSVSGAANAFGGGAEDELGQMCSLVRLLVEPALPHEHDVAGIIGSAMLAAEQQRAQSNMLGQPQEYSGSGLHSVGDAVPGSGPAAGARAPPSASAPAGPNSQHTLGSYSNTPYMLSSMPPGMNSLAESYSGNNMTCPPTPTTATAELRYLADALTARGYEVMVCSSSGAGASADCLHNLRHHFLTVVIPGPSNGGNGFIDDGAMDEALIPAMLSPRHMPLGDGSALGGYTLGSSSGAVGCGGLGRAATANSDLAAQVEGLVSFDMLSTGGEEPTHSQIYASLPASAAAASRGGGSAPMSHNAHHGLGLASLSRRSITGAGGKPLGMGAMGMELYGIMEAISFGADSSEAPTVHGGVPALHGSASTAAEHRELPADSSSVPCSEVSASTVSAGSAATLMMAAGAARVGSKSSTAAAGALAADASGPSAAAPLVARTSTGLDLSNGACQVGVAGLAAANGSNSSAARLHALVQQGVGEDERVLGAAAAAGGQVDPYASSRLHALMNVCDTSMQPCAAPVAKGSRDGSQGAVGSGTDAAFGSNQAAHCSSAGTSGVHQPQVQPGACQAPLSRSSLKLGSLHRASSGGIGTLLFGGGAPSVGAAGPQALGGGLAPAAGPGGAGWEPPSSTGSLGAAMMTMGATGDTRVIVDPTFRDQFEIGKHANERYEALLSVLPRVYVGQDDRLPLLVELLCEEMAAAFKERGVPIPPWRRAASLLSKWRPRTLSPSRAGSAPVTQDLVRPGTAAGTPVTGGGLGLGGVVGRVSSTGDFSGRGEFSGSGLVQGGNGLAAPGLQPLPVSGHAAGYTTVRSGELSRSMQAGSHTPRSLTGFVAPAQAVQQPAEPAHGQPDMADYYELGAGGCSWRVSGRTGLPTGPVVRGAAVPGAGMFAGDGGEHLLPVRQRSRLDLQSVMGAGQGLGVGQAGVGAGGMGPSGAAGAPRLPAGSVAPREHHHPRVDGQAPLPGTGAGMHRGPSNGSVSAVGTAASMAMGGSLGVWLHDGGGHVLRGANDSVGGPPSARTSASGVGSLCVSTAGNMSSISGLPASHAQHHLAQNAQLPPDAQAGGHGGMWAPLQLQQLLPQLPEGDPRLSPRASAAAAPAAACRTPSTTQQGGVDSPAPGREGFQRATMALTAAAATGRSPPGQLPKRPSSSMAVVTQPLALNLEEVGGLPLTAESPRQWVGAVDGDDAGGSGSGGRAGGPRARTG